MRLALSLSTAACPGPQGSLGVQAGCEGDGRYGGPVIKPWPCVKRAGSAMRAGKLCSGVCELH